MEKIIPKARGTKVYIGNLVDSVGNDKLLRAFQRFGTILSVWVARSPKGFAFVEFVDYEDAVIAVDRMDGKELFESVLKVELATTYSRRPPPKRPEDRKNSFRKCPSPPGPARTPSMRDAAAAAANPYNRSTLVHVPGQGMVLQTPLPSYPMGYDNGSACITPQMTLQQAQWYQAQQLLGQQYAGTTCLPPGYQEMQAQTAITPYSAATNGATTGAVANYVSYPQTPGMLTNYGLDQTLSTPNPITSPNSNHSQSVTTPNATYSQVAATPVVTPTPYSQPQISTRDGHATSTSSPANQGLMNFRQDNRYKNGGAETPVPQRFNRFQSERTGIPPPPPPPRRHGYAPMPVPPVRPMPGYNNRQGFRPIA